MSDDEDLESLLDDPDGPEEDEDDDRGVRVFAYDPNEPENAQCATHGRQAIYVSMEGKPGCQLCDEADGLEDGDGWADEDDDLPPSPDDAE